MNATWACGMGARILVINGPNLNMLGVRQPEIYGSLTLADVEALCLETARDLAMTLTFRQSNAEGDLVTWIQDARDSHDGIALNAGAYTHTSIAILDAIKACGRPVVEIHLSNIHAREDFRHRSYVALAARGAICGFGADGYRLALLALDRIIEGDTPG